MDGFSSLEDQATVVQSMTPALIRGSIGDYQLATLKEKATEVFITADASGVDPVLAIISGHIAEWQKKGITCDTKKGRDEIRSFANKITKSKTALEKVGKEIADEVKKIPTLVDASRRKVKETIEQWHKDVRQPLTDWEEADEARQEKHKALIAQVEARGNSDDMTADDIRKIISEVRALVFGEECEEFLPNYVGARARAIEKLEIALPKRVALEAEQAEAKRLREENRALAEKQREIEKQLAAEQAKNAPAAPPVHTLLGGAVEVTEAPTTVAEALSQPRPEPDVELQRTRNREALAALVANGIEDAIARKVISMVAAGVIPFMSMDYRS